VTGRKLPVRYGPRRAGDPPVLSSDVGRIREVLGFAPNWTDIDAVVRSAWNWHCKEAAAASPEAQVA
jgi:UDP-glucose 4-epimerase